MAQSELDKINSSSTEEEEEEEEELSSESSTDSESDKNNNNNINSSSSMKPSAAGEHDSPPKHSETADPNIKPLASKPMDENDDNEDEPFRKPRPKNPTSRYSPPPLKAKRKAAELEAESKKEAVTVAAVASEIVGEKKQLFQRLWSEEDEIQLIKGMIDYVEKKGKDPIADVNDFHEFVKSCLNIDVNNAQMSAKIKRLKAKFMNNIGKIEQKGKVRSLSNPHEKVMYELSEKLWGRDRKKNASLVSCGNKKVNAKGKPLTNLKQKNGNFGEGNVSNGIGVVELSDRGVMRGPMTDEDIMRNGLELVSGAKKVELEEKWDDLKLQEFKHFMKKLELMHEQAELLLSVIDESEAS